MIRFSQYRQDAPYMRKPLDGTRVFGGESIWVMSEHVQMRIAEGGGYSRDLIHWLLALKLNLGNLGGLGDLRDLGASKNLQT